MACYRLILAYSSLKKRKSLYYGRTMVRTTASQLEVSSFESRLGPFLWNLHVFLVSV